MEQYLDWWAYEREAADDGWRIICGVDEAGRGCLAGPVFAAAVILPQGLVIDGLDDSKRLKPAVRESLYEQILQCAVSYGVASASEQEIEAVNILNATYLAMNRAIAKLEPQAELALIDGNRSTGIEYINRCIIGGDGKSASIAAASILAKVSRDRFMTALSQEYPQYRFEKHKGYATALHYEMIRAHGPSVVHRKSFLKKLH